MPVYIEKSGDLVRCHHSGTDNRTRKDRTDSANGPRTAEMSKNFLPQHKIHREDYIGIVVGYIRTVFVKYTRAQGHSLQALTTCHIPQDVEVDNRH